MVRAGLEELCRNEETLNSCRLSSTKKLLRKWRTLTYDLLSGQRGRRKKRSQGQKFEDCLADGLKWPCGHCPPYERELEQQNKIRTSRWNYGYALCRYNCNRGYCCSCSCCSFCYLQLQVLLWWQLVKEALFFCSARLDPAPPN